MEIELAEIRDFIASHPPFDVLHEALLDRLPKKLSIRYFRQGSAFPDEKKAKEHLYVIRAGAVEIRDQNSVLLDKLAEGDIYLADSFKKDNLTRVQSVCIEDTLVYFLDTKELQLLQQQSTEFSHQFNKSINGRLRQAIETSYSSEMRGLSAMKMEVSSLTDRLPITVDIATSIQEAAKLMTEEQVSSVLVSEQNKLVGLMTDRDIKTRCVAEGMDYTSTVHQIMTANPQTVSATTLLSEALLLMTRSGINHLPVMENEKTIGMLTTSDVIRHLSTSPALIASDVFKANSVAALTKISTRLPELQLQLSLSGSTAKHIGEVFSSITDAITCRLLELAEVVLGKAPVSYVWLSAGSQARNEQTSYSDQDNALILSDSFSAEHEAYFDALAEFVTDGLNACGYVYCPGNAMASNSQWRQPLNKWLKNFSGWINSPEPKALMLSSIFFDMRPIHGDFLLFDTLQNKILKQTVNNEFFISHMVGNALTHRPPLGFFRNFVMEHDEEHKDTLNIKLKGIIPIVDLARVIALDKGIKAVNTTERLEEAFNCGAISDEMHRNLIDALEYISSLRIRHQAKNIRLGQKADNYLPLDEMSGIEKNHLKDAFSIIKTMQMFYENIYSSSRVE